MLGAPVTPAIDADDTIEPGTPASTIAALTTESTVNAPSTLTSNTRCASTWGYRSTRPNLPWYPALLKRPDGTPIASRHACTERITASASVTSNASIHAGAPRVAHRCRVSVTAP